MLYGKEIGVLNASEGFVLILIFLENALRLQYDHAWAGCGHMS